MTNSDFREDIYNRVIEDLAKLRDRCLWDAYPEYRGALMGCPREVISFAEERIKELEKKNKALLDMIDKITN